MAQAKGVLPTKGDDRAVLYRNPKTCGYFVGIRLVPDATRDQALDWLGTVSTAIDTLVTRTAPDDEYPKGRKVAAVAAGFAAGFFDRLNSTASTIEPPVGLTPDAQPAQGLFPGVAALDVDALFYIASVSETRVKEFMSAVAESPLVDTVTLERGYQRSDETEPFGYKDGVRNVRLSDRSRVVYVHTEHDQPDEPAWADGGTYMVFMKIVQKPAVFQALADDAARDTVIGRTKDGTRLDLVGQGIAPHDEPNDVPVGLPPTSHVRKAGPRGPHDDNEIFRRGMPFMEVADGHLQVGLQFCSFQANPGQFDTIFNDWLLNQQFPPRDDNATVGSDALLSGGFTEIREAGLFFVPPYHPDGLVAALTPAVRRKPPSHGRLAISKFVESSTEPTRRFERGGFQFRVTDASGVAVPNSEFETNSAGRGVCPAELEIGQTYQLVEASSPRPDVGLTTLQFVMDKPNKNLRVTNQVQPGGGYGNR